MTDDTKKTDAPTSKRGGGTGMGRKTKLTRALIDGFTQVLTGTSTPIATIAEAAGVHRGTLFAWLAKGEKAKSGIYRDFYDAITIARAAGTQATLAQMRTLGLKSGDWREMAWELERTRPKQFGLRVRVHVEEELTTVFNLLKNEFQKEPAIWERIARVIAGELSPEGPDDADAGAEEVPTPTAEPEKPE